MIAIKFCWINFNIIATGNPTVKIKHFQSFLNLLLQFYLRLFVYQLIAYYSLYAATNCSAIAKISVASKSGAG
jgi:hypothetical protein